jgi:hypothetical protein
VPHSLLIHKLKRKFGFNSNLLDWFINYWTGRSQRVIYKGCFSKYVNVLSGVPQGSILGPMLFLFYINDIFECINPYDCTLSLYADDSKLSCCIRNINDCINLQHHLSALAC